MLSNVRSQLNESRMESRPVSRFAGVRVHFIGIGGCGMSGLARVLLDAGAIISGSEPKPNAQTFDLARRGVRISRTQGGELLSREIDLDQAHDLLAANFASTVNGRLTAAEVLGHREFVMTKLYESA